MDHESDPRIIDLANRTLADLKTLEKNLNDDANIEYDKMTMDDQNLGKTDFDLIPESHKRGGWQQKLTIGNRRHYNLIPGNGSRRVRYVKLLGDGRGGIVVAK